MDEPADAPSVRRARAAAMRVPPISPILDGQETPGSGYGPKYTGTVWSLMFLDQMGADPRDRRIRRACRYVLEHTQAPNGGFGWSNRDGGVVHCLNGNLLRALIDFGLLDDPSVRESVEWQARSITGKHFDGYHAGPRRDRDSDAASTGPSRARGVRSRRSGDWRRSRRGDARASSATRSVSGSASCSPVTRRPRTIRPTPRSVSTGSGSASHPVTSPTSCRTSRC